MSLRSLSVFLLTTALLGPARADVPMNAIQFVENFKLTRMSSASQAALYSQIADQTLEQRRFENDFARQMAADEIKKKADAIAARDQKENYPKEIVFDVDYLISDKSYAFDEGRLCLQPFFKGFAQVNAGFGSSRLPISSSVMLGSYVRPQDFHGFEVGRSMFSMRFHKSLSFCVKMEAGKVQAALSAGRDYKGHNFAAGFEEWAVVAPERSAKIIRGFPGKAHFRIEGDLIVDTVGISMHFSRGFVDFNGQELAFRAK